MSEETTKRTIYSPIEERHIDFLLEEEFATNAEFLDYFLAVAATAKTKEALIPARHSSWRCEAVRSVTTSAGESDLVVRYDAADQDGEIIALLIEDKIRAAFQDEQAGRYRRRGEAGLGIEWDKYWTCLVSPAKYISADGDFDSRVSLEALRDYFAKQSGPRAKFRVDVLTRALTKASAVGVQNEDRTITAFRARYEAIARENLELPAWQWDPPRTGWSGDTWFNFRRRSWLPSLKIVHKAQMGAVHLVIPNTAVSHLDDLLRAHSLDERFTAVQTNKSASLQISIPRVTDFSSDMSEATTRALYAAIRSLDEGYALLHESILILLRPSKDRA